MTSKHPPGIATWMLKHFGCGPNNDAVLGDLAEQYLQKDSAMWYWRQAMKAIPVSFFKEIRGHKWLAARALLTGWVVWFLGAMMIFPIVFTGTNVGFGIDPRHLPNPIDILQGLLWTPVIGPASLRRGGPWITSFTYVFATTLPLIVGAVSGWLVARTDIGFDPGRPGTAVFARYRRDLPLLFAGSIFLMNLLLFGPFILRVGPTVAYIFVGPLAVEAAASVLGVLFGGGIFRDRSRIVSNQP